MPRCANSSTFCVHVSVLSSEARVFGTARGWWFSILKKNQLFCYITSETHKALAFTKPGCNSPSSSRSSTASQVHKKQLGNFSYWFLLIYFLKSWDLSFLKFDDSLVLQKPIWRWFQHLQPCHHLRYSGGSFMGQDGWIPWNKHALQRPWFPCSFHFGPLGFRVGGV